MRPSTYLKLERLYKRRRGYVSTRDLLEEGFTNRQIAILAEEDYLDKVCHGYYWMKQCGCDKPEDYRCLEVCLSNPQAVIAMVSACYYQGIAVDKPQILSVATRRTDRSKIKMSFPVQRHYFSDDNFQVGLKTRQTEFGNYNIYSIERSFCDMVRLHRHLGDERLSLIIFDYMEADKRRYERMSKYAKMLKMGNNDLELLSGGTSHGMMVT